MHPLTPPKKLWYKKEKFNVGTKSLECELVSSRFSGAVVNTADWTVQLVG